MNIEETIEKIKDLSDERYPEKELKKIIQQIRDETLEQAAKVCEDINKENKLMCYFHTTEEINKAIRLIRKLKSEN